MSETHEEFLQRVKGAPQDISRPVFEDLISQGYEICRWNTSVSAVDGPCLSEDGNQFTLEEFISGLMHDAPIYEKTHVGCTCTVTCEGPGLDPVEVSAFGIV